MAQTFIEKHGLEEYVEDRTEKEKADELHDIHRVKYGIEMGAYRRIQQYLRQNVHKFYPEIDLSFLRMQNHDVGVAIEYATPDGGHMKLKDKNDGVLNDLSNYERVSSPSLVKAWLTGLPRFSIFEFHSSSHYHLSLTREGNAKWGGEEYTITPASWAGEAKGIRGCIPEKSWNMVGSFTSKEPHYKIYSSSRNKKIELEAEFIGFLPKETQRKIEAATHIFGDSQYFAHIYIIKEETDWKIAPVGDPLVIGTLYGEYNHPGKAYLIDQFDATPLERYIAAEFTLGGEK